MKKLISLILFFAVTACGTAAPPASISSTSTPIPPPPTNTALPTLPPIAVPSGPCDNPLVPLAVGNQWEYSAAIENRATPYTLRSVERQDGANIATLLEFTDHRLGVTDQELVVCRDGAIENFPLFVMSMLLFDYLHKIFDTYHDVGVYAPSYQTLMDNNWAMSWSADYMTEQDAYIRNPMGGSDLLVLPSTPMQLYFQTDGTREPITTLIGEFPQALKVFHDFSLLVSITIPGGATSGRLTIKTTQWYEPYVGLLRAQIDTASIELAPGQEISVPIKSAVELTGFISGK